MKTKKHSKGQALTEYIVIAGFAAVGIYVALMGTSTLASPPSSRSNVIVSADQNLTRTADGVYITSSEVPCDRELENKLSAGVANLIVNRQSCVRKSLFSL